MKPRKITAYDVDLAKKVASPSPMISTPHLLRKYSSRSERDNRLDARAVL